jgi:hypothetical protein
MDFHLDTLLNLPDVTVESCLYQDNEVVARCRWLFEKPASGATILDCDF